MWLEQIEQIEQLEKIFKRILSHPGVESKKLSPAKFLICYEGGSWFLWPRSGRYQWVENGEAVSDVYYSDVRMFYERYILKTLDLPKNFGKQWSKDDENVLYEMIESGDTIRQMADELERHPVSVARKVAEFLDKPRLAWCGDDDMCDVGIDELKEMF